MNELKEMYIEAEKTLYKKGYYVDNMINDSNCYEISDKSGKILIDNLSLIQLHQLSKML
ncbi:MAG: hypothetical protein MR384_06785 [Lachnospiraceae bacterium]|nr:hypothetical protein [Lachnospiraceae bacterium]